MAAREYEQNLQTLVPVEVSYGAKYIMPTLFHH
jgi:hypothetical protein